MNKVPYHLPRGRKRQLITREVAGELIVYDLENDRVHCLNSTAAFVWTHCDGQTSVTTMARLLEDEIKTPVEQELILYALSLLLVFITHTTHRMEIAGIAAVFFEVFTEIKDEIINGACGGINVISPN